MKNIIIEGVSGSGKTTILKEITKILNSNKINHKIFSEDITFGDFMTEIKENKTKNKLFRLHEINNKIKETNDKVIILERFHLSYYAITGNWEQYKIIDEYLAENNFVLILLSYNNNFIFDRAINHFDIKDKVLLDDFINYFGSFDNMLKSYEESQNRRLNALNKTKLKYLNIDTSERKWDKYLSKIYNFII